MSKLLTQNELNKIRNSVFDYHPYAELLFDHIDILTTELKSSESRLHEVAVVCANAEAELKRRDALSKPEPCYWEIAGQLFSTKEEALKPGYIGTPEPLWDDSVFDYLSQRDALAEIVISPPPYLSTLTVKTLHEIISSDNSTPAERIMAEELLFWNSQKLYAAPPAPAVPNELEPTSYAPDYADGWNACRAAILTSSPLESRLSNAVNSYIKMTNQQVGYDGNVAWCLTAFDMGAFDNLFEPLIGRAAMLANKERMK